jgi:hypothetical protein
MKQVTIGAFSLLALTGCPVNGFEKNYSARKTITVTLNRGAQH